LNDSTNPFTEGGGLRLRLDLELHYFSIFFTENNENDHLIFLSRIFTC